MKKCNLTEQDKMRLLKAYLTSYSSHKAIAVGDACADQDGNVGQISALVDIEQDEIELVTPKSLYSLAAVVLEFENYWVTVDYRALENEMRPVQ